MLFPKLLINEKLNARQVQVLVLFSHKAGLLSRFTWFTRRLGGRKALQASYVPRRQKHPFPRALLGKPQVGAKPTDFTLHLSSLLPLPWGLGSASHWLSSHIFSSDAGQSSFHIRKRGEGVRGQGWIPGNAPRLSSVDRLHICVIITMTLIHIFLFDPW